MGERLKDVKPEEWDALLKDYLRNHRNEFKTIFPQIRYVLVDEFQDITAIRLEYLKELHAIFPDAKFFTIGDINQSIYGYDRIPESKIMKIRTLSPGEYARLVDPRPYYDEWNTLLEPKRMTMFTNYRSYQAILDFSARYLPKGSEMPSSSEYLIQHTPQGQYVFEESVLEEDVAVQPWLNNIRETVAWAKNENSSGDSTRRIHTVAVFFRTNAEMFRAYSYLRDLPGEGVRLRIQGQSICELWRKREFFEVVRWLSTTKMKDKVFRLNNNSKEERYETYGDIMSLIDRGIRTYKDRWDVYYMDVLKSLIHHYVDSINADDKTHTFGEMADYIMELADKDDCGQIYKIYDRYHTDDKTVFVVLTTMHKVKGLEFDAVITVPSVASLPLKRQSSGMDLTAADFADLDEERRLMFVACSRAKKRLMVFTGPREKALMKGTAYSFSNDSSKYIYEKDPNLNNYMLSYNAWGGKDGNDKNYEAIKKVRAHESVFIKMVNGNYYIFTNDNTILGRLASQKTSNIVKWMNQKRVQVLKGFFVSDVVTYTYSESLEYDKKNRKNFSGRWCDNARKRGYVYIPIISGMGE